MKTRSFNPLIHHLNPKFSSQNFLFHFPSLPQKNSIFINFSNRKLLHTPRSLSFYSATPSDSLNYGGWDHPQPNSDSVNSGESNQLQNFLNSLGINDKKYIFMYLLGFACALTISRIRVSSIIVFPACVIVFGIGFSIGYVKRRDMNGLSLMGGKKTPKDENSRGSKFEKLRSLVGMFNEFDEKVVNLKNSIKRGIECSQITVGDLESYIKEMDSIGLFAWSARNAVESCIGTTLVESQETERTSNQKTSKKRKEVDGSGFDLSRFTADLFQERSAGSKPNKVKNFNEREMTDIELNEKQNILAREGEERDLNSLSNVNVGNENSGFRDITNSSDLKSDGKEVLLDGRGSKVIAGNKKMNFASWYSSAKKDLENEEYSYQSKRSQSTNGKHTSMNMDHHNEVETRASHDGLIDSVDFSLSVKHMKTKASFSQEQTLQEFNGNFRPSDNGAKNEQEFYIPPMREEQIADDDRVPSDHQSAHRSDLGSTPSSVAPDDMVFNRYLMEANSLLKEARESLKRRDDEGQAENALKKSARLLSRAVDLRPMSLLAVGQLGNTYLLHGELKLKISRELRFLLARSEPLLVEKWSKVLTGLDDQVVSKEKIRSTLVDVCEECEELLVKAGRRYKLALSIDGSDMRAFYNWGLALSFRAQLIADIGPEAALDADKIFLAAIDKFDAMMSKSNACAPDALFRWAAALQQRSHLRPRNSKEKVKLLQQAKRLYEDALDMDSNNLQVRKALSSCLSDLDYWNC